MLMPAPIDPKSNVMFGAKKSFTVNLATILSLVVNPTRPVPNVKFTPS